MLPFVLLLMSATSLQPLEIVSFNTVDECAAALANIRMVTNETRPLKHFCLPRDQFAALVANLDRESFVLFQNEKD